MKNKVLGIVASSIFLVVFNVFFYNTIDVYSNARWVAYGAIHIAYFFLLVACYSIPKVDDGLVHGYPKIGVAWGYFFITLLANLVLILVNNETPTFPIVVNAIVTGFYLLIYCGLMATESHAMASDVRDARHMDFIRTCSADLKATMDECRDNATRRIVERAYDAIRGAEVASIPAVADLESQISIKISDLSADFSSLDKGGIETAVNEIRILIRKRDQQIRLSH